MIKTVANVAKHEHKNDGSTLVRNGYLQNNNMITFDEDREIRTKTK